MPDIDHHTTARLAFARANLGDQKRQGQRQASAERFGLGIAADVAAVEHFANYRVVVIP